MIVPGPNGAAWAVSLLIAAAAAVVVGEVARWAVGRLVPSWRKLDPIERLLLDFYLGGATLYAIAAVPVGAFDPVVIFALPVLALGAILLREWARSRRPNEEPLARRLARIRRPAILVALASALVLYLLELAIALPIGTGNTFDSSLLTTYTALLLQHHAIALSFRPYASLGILYPQGTTVWLGWTQSIFGLPPARSSLLVTPLFLGLAPLGGFVLGRRWFGTDRGAVAIAIVLAFLGPGTRAMVGGSNDFVFAFPLVLLLLGQSVQWVRSRPPPVAEAVAFGLLLGYSAAMNPVGAEWVFVALLVAGALARPRFGAAGLAWMGRWSLALGSALVPILPTLVVLGRGWGSPGFVPGAASPPAGSLSGLTSAQFVGSIDPYLFRPTDVQLSAVPLLRLELAVLLTLGLALLLFVGRRSALGRYLETARLLTVSGVIATVGLLGVLWIDGRGFGPADAFARLSSGAELSGWLFNLYGVIAALPLVLALEAIAFPRRLLPCPAPAEVPWARSPWSLPGRTGRSSPKAIPWAIALAVIVPGVALTPTALPGVLTTLYEDFGNVTTSDFMLLEYAGTHLPPGARVLVAPGSAGEFLPGYASNIVLLYPLVPGWTWINASYRLLVSELTNGTLDAAGLGAFSALLVGFVAVTGNNTVLWPAFSPAPLLADPSGFPVLFHSGDAYLFGRVGT